MGRKSGFGLAAVACMLLAGCNRSDTSMQEAFWCASYGTCKPTTTQLVQPKAAAADASSFCSYYGNCAQPTAPAITYDTCAVYGICDRGS